MSVLLYSNLTKRRIATPNNVDVKIVPDSAATAGATETTTPATPGAAGQPSAAPEPNVTKWVDVVAALVPAEVLGLHAFAVLLCTKSIGEGDEATVSISNPAGLRWAFYLGIVAAIVLYMSSSKKWGDWVEWVRSLIVAAAFVVWTVLQATSAFDGVVSGMDTGTRAIIGAFGAAMLGALAAALAVKAQNSSQ